MATEKRLYPVREAEAVINELAADRWTIDHIQGVWVGESGEQTLDETYAADYKSGIEDPEFAINLVRGWPQDESFCLYLSISRPT